MRQQSEDIEQWDDHAELYAESKGLEGDELHNTLIQPILDEFLDDVSGKRILDAGCGNGFVARQLAESAEMVVGVDASKKLLERANKHSLRENTTFEWADLTQKLSFADDHFDIVVSIMVLQYLPEIETFADECARILKPGGQLIAVIDHPSHALFLRAQELAGKKNEKFITSDNYFAEGPRKKHSLWDKAILQYYHRPISFYINSFAPNFRLAALRETTSDNEVPRILGFHWALAQK